MAILLKDIQTLSRGTYLQLVTRIRLLDDAIIRSNEPEEVLTYTYKEEAIGNRFIIPWRKVKGKVRRSALEAMRGQGIAEDCALKSKLCMKCPCCVLFGGTGDMHDDNDKRVGYNLLSRVLGDTFISTEKVGEINTYTANAVDEATLSTGQALMTVVKVPTETEFVGVITLRDPTPEGTSILVDAIERTTRIGASTREWGRCRTTIDGYVLGNRESLSSYEFAKGDSEELIKLEKLKLPSADKAFKDFANACDKALEDMPKKKTTKAAKKKAEKKKAAK